MEKLEFRATYYYLLEKSDHDGYCSGEECNYSEEVITYPYPSLISSLYHPTIKSSGLLTNIDANEWLGYLPNEKINTDQTSYYCNNSELSILKGLGIHDYRQTIILIEINIVEKKNELVNIQS